MASAGISSYDPTQYHTWTLVYHQDDSYEMYCDGVRVQGGKSYLWTEAQDPNGKPVDMTFLFDAAWGHTGKEGEYMDVVMNKELDASILQGKYYEFDYSRVYLGPAITTPTTPAVTLRTPENPSGTVAGLSYSYYEVSGLSSLPDFTQLTPTARGTVSTVDIAPRQRDDDFAFRYTGYVTVPTDGTYTFSTTSDDGSQLFIGSQLVVDNDGLHGAQKKSGTIGLKAGTHALTINFFERGGGQLLSASYAGPGLSKQPLPASVLAYVPAAAPAAGIVSGGTYRLLARHSGKALDVDANGSASATRVQQWAATDHNPAQQWVLELQSDGAYTLTHQGTNHRLGDSKLDGGTVWQYLGNNSDAQRWVITPTTDGYYKLVHKNTSKCLDVSGGETPMADGAVVLQYEYWGGKNQQWKLERLDALALATARVTTLAAPSSTAAAPASAGSSPLSAYPNPSQGPATLSFAAARAQHVTVYVHNAQGQLVNLLSVPALAGHTDFALPSSLPMGTYLLRATIDGVKQHFTLRVN